MYFRTRTTIILTYCILAAAGTTFTQATSGKCFEIGHRDFFGLQEKQEIRWPIKEIDGLIKLQLKGEHAEQSGWMLPIVGYQLEDFHPACGSSRDLERFEKLMTLYLKIRHLDAADMAGMSIKDQLEFVRLDLNVLVKSDKYLPWLIYTVDDGPLYGEAIKGPTKFRLKQKVKTVKTPFGILTIGETEQGVAVEARNGKNKLMWARILKGVNPDRYLKRPDLEKVDLQNSSIATVLRFFVEGERLTMYIRPTGRFIFYRHSW